MKSGLFTVEFFRKKVPGKFSYIKNIGYLCDVIKNKRVMSSLKEIFESIGITNSIPSDPKYIQ